MCTIFTDFEYPVKKLKRELLFLFQTKALKIMGEILKMNTIHDYHEFLGVKTLHPLVSVIDLSEVPPIRMARKNLGFYTVFLKDVKCGDLRYGRKMYDYQEGTLVFIGPGQIVGDDDNGTRVQAKGWAYFFIPICYWGHHWGAR